MSNITIGNEESQADNQKTTPVTESPFELNNSSISLPGCVLQIWLDYTTKLERISKKNAELKPRRLPAKG